MLEQVNKLTEEEIKDLDSLLVKVQTFCWDGARFMASVQSKEYRESLGDPRYIRSEKKKQEIDQAFKEFHALRWKEHTEFGYDNCRKIRKYIERLIGKEI